MTHKSPEAPNEPKVAIYAGSFNPFTKGHLSVLIRAADIFDRVIVAIGVNAAKSDVSKAAERLAAVNEAIQKLPPELRERCHAMIYNSLTASLARKMGARWLVRGARSASEFEAEIAMAEVNRHLAALETVIIPPLPELAFISSSIVRELDSYGVDTSSLLP
ncbi:MAG: pantetheine-phosphate adenylyltransferase [Pseudoflavonifractor sp.]|nr:pantetheine-phosphate adenylyltransferase [Alloprevotella sp.]MCM1115936.1 pantetheine-phosphate adenylyltransferase [Pseudoflavonifractor sp.]